MSLKAAYTPRAGASVPEKGGAATSASASASTAAPANSSKSKAVSLEERGQAMLPKRADSPTSKDPGMSHTRIVLEAARAAATPEAQKFQRWRTIVAEASVAISRVPLIRAYAHAGVPSEISHAKLTSIECKIGVFVYL